jgi:hypothetical protein
MRVVHMSEGSLLAFDHLAPPPSRFRRRRGSCLASRAASACGTFAVRRSRSRVRVNFACLLGLPGCSVGISCDRIFLLCEFLVQREDEGVEPRAAPRGWYGRRRIQRCQVSVGLNLSAEMSVDCQ